MHKITSHETSLHETRHLYETTSKDIQSNAEERCVLAEKRRETSQASAVRLQAQLDAMKEETMKAALQHQSALDEMEVRIHEEVQNSSNGAFQQLETELRATTAARDAMLARREGDQVIMKKERERSEAQVVQLQTLLEEGRAAATAQRVQSAETLAQVDGHQIQVDTMVTEHERLLSTIDALKQQQSVVQALHTSEMKRFEESKEIERMRWKKDSDDKDKRIHLLEKVCRDRDAEKIQRVANTVSLFILFVFFYNSMKSNKGKKP